MKPIVSLMIIAAILSFKILAEAPEYYLSLDCCVIQVKSDRMIARNYGITVGTYRISLMDTIGVFSLYPCGDGFYQVTQVFDNKNDPFTDMSYEIRHGVKIEDDSFTVRIRLPQIRNEGNVSIKVVTPGASYNTYYKDSVYEAKISRKASVISFEITPKKLNPQHLHLPIPLQGIYLGKIKFQSKSICLENLDSGLIDILDVNIPGFKNNIFSNLYIPDSYIHIENDRAKWIGQELNRIDSRISNP